MFKQNAFFAAALLATLASTSTASLANTGPLTVNCEQQALSEGPLTLQAAAARAVCLHPLSRQAQARLEGAQAQLQGASAALSPQLNASVSMSAADATGAPSGSSTSLVQVRASQVLLDGGLRQAQVEAAELQARASEADVRAQAQALTLQAARHFYNHQTALSQLKSAEESVRAAQVAHDAAKARLEAGVAVKVDVLQAQAQLAQAQMDQAQAQGAVDVSLAALLQHVALPQPPAQ